MSITDELREYASGWWDRKCHDHLLGIADRIDREHRMALEKVAADAYLDGAPTEAQLGELGYIAMPLDADGVPIRVGDEVDSDHYEDGTVIGIRYELSANGAIGELVAVRPHGWDTATWYDPEEYRHHHTPTVEDVLREFGDWYAHVKGGCDEDGIVAEYAAKLRLAGEGDA